MTIPLREIRRLHIAHLVSDPIDPEHLRVVQILFRAGGDGSAVVADHGSRLCRWFLGEGILPREAWLTHAPARWWPRFSGLADFLWQQNADAVHIHGGAVAAAGLAAARWLDLPVIYTPDASAEGAVAAPRCRLFAGLFGRDPLRRADGLVLLGDRPGATVPPASGKPVLHIAAGAPAAPVTARYRGLMEEIDRRIGREPRGAPAPQPA